ncbi:MAG: ABC transporter permease, partial [Bacteroidota bacterium]
MLRNYLTIIHRTVLQNKLGYFLNIFGLAIGMATFLFIFYFVNYELSFDNFHENKNEIFRVALEQYENGQLLNKTAENYPGVGPALEEGLPEVINFTRLYNLGAKNNIIISREDIATKQGYKVKRFLFADSEFLNIFSFPLTQGDRATCLSDAKTAIISESFARKVFKQENPMGKVLKMVDDDFKTVSAKVTGVFKEVPSNSHLKFDVLFSYPSLLGQTANGMEQFYNSWQSRDIYTYIQTKPSVDHQKLQTKLPQLVDQYKPDLAVFNLEDKLLLQPVTSIHLGSHLANEAERNGQKQTIYALTFAGILVLLLALVNFLNYSIARSMTRAKDFGLRKVFGAVKQNLFSQFIFEAGFLNFIAIVGAVLIALLCFPYFKSMANLEAATISSFLINKTSFLGLGFSWIAGIIFGGILPAIILSRFDLVAIVKGKILGFGQGLKLRKGLIIFQITASIALTFICLVILSQINYLINFDLGVDLKDTIVLDRPGVGPKPGERTISFDRFKSTLETEPSITSVTGTSAIPGKRIRLRKEIKSLGFGNKKLQEVDFTAVDEQFLPSMGLEVIAGRNFSKEISTDADTAAIITKETVSLLGFKTPEEAIGKLVSLEEFNWNPIIVGVTDNYHHLSLREESFPTLFFLNSFMSEYYLVKFNPEQRKTALSKIESVWKTVYPQNP